MNYWVLNSVEVETHLSHLSFYRMLVQFRLSKGQRWSYRAEVFWSVTTGEWVQRGQVIACMHVSRCYGDAWVDIKTPHAGWMEKINPSSLCFPGKKMCGVRIDVEWEIQQGRRRSWSPTSLLDSRLVLEDKPDVRKFRCKADKSRVCSCPLRLPTE